MFCWVHAGSQADTSGQQAQKSGVTLDNIFDGVWLIQEDEEDAAVTANHDTADHEQVRACTPPDPSS